MSFRFSTSLVWAILVASFVGALIQRGGVMLGFWSQTHNPNFAFSSLIVASYCVSLVLSLRIAREHENSPAMHFAWMLFAGSCLFSIVRHAIYCAEAINWIADSHSRSFYVLTQIPMAIALVLFFVALLSMWSAFSALGLGFHITRLDVAIVTVMLLMLPPILSRNPEALPKFVSGWITILPLAGSILLPACGAIAVFLHRTAIQMRGGETARVLQCLICYPAMRLIAMLINIDSHLSRSVPLMVFAYAVFHTAPLVLALALTYRWRITAKATVAMRAERASWDRYYPVVTSVS